MYSILIDDKENGKQKCAASRGSRRVLKIKELHHELYRKILQGPVVINETEKTPEDHYVPSDDLPIKKPHWVLHSGSM